MRSPLCPVVLALLLVASCGATLAQPTPLPTWPQKFVLRPGERAIFGFPVTQPGAITVTLEWRGRPMEVALLGPTGKPVAAPSVKAPPTGSLTYAAMAQDVAQGMLWAVRLSVAPDQNPAAGPTGEATSGMVTVAAPPADAGKVAATLQTLLQARSKVAPNRGLPPPPRPDDVSARATALDKERLDRVARLNTQLEATARMEVQKRDAMRAETRSRLLASAGGSGLGAELRATLGRVTRPGGLRSPGPNNNPDILAVTPGAGKPRDTVVLEAVNITPDPGANQVWFEVAKGTTRQATVASIKADGEHFDVEVRVPDQSVLSPAYNGQVSLKAVDKNVTTTGIPFRWEPAAPPSIDLNQYDPWECGDMAWLRGKGFTQTDKVYFQFGSAPPVPAVTAPKNSSPGVLELTVPSIIAKQETLAQVWVESVAHGTSNKRGIRIAPTVPVISSTDRTEIGPDEYLYIRGSRFTYQPEIHFVFPNGQDLLGKYSAMSTSICILVRAPSAVTPPGDVQVYVKTDGGTSDPVKLKYKPVLSVQRISFAVPAVSTDVHIALGEASKDFCVWPTDGSYAHVYHANGMFIGHKGDDEFLKSFHLKNGWVVDSISFSQIPEAGGSRIEESHVGTDWAYVRVHWWVDFDWFKYATQYMLTIYIRGPKDVPWY